MYDDNRKNEGFCEALFKAPPQDCGAVYTWIWNTHITCAGIKKQTDEFFAAGIKGVYIIAEPENFRPESKKTYLSPDYLTDDFMRLIAYAYECARERGIVMWLYDEGGFPSGGACGQVQKHNSEATMQIILKHEKALKAGEKYIPEKGSVAAFSKEGKIGAGFAPQRDTTVDEYVVCDFVHGPNMVDITNPSVTDTFISLTHERYKRFLGKSFGKGLDMMFTDEPFLPRQMWSKNFAHDFAAEYGYDITDFVDCICDESRAEAASQKRARIDYGRLLGKRIKEGFFEKIAHWCEENSLKLCGHLNYDDDVCGSVEGGYYSVLDILRCFHIPGVDAIGRQIFPEKTHSAKNTCAFYPRLASSAAAQRGGGLALSESMAVYGDGVTFDEMRYVLGYQLVRGINIFNMMILSYGKERALALGLRPCFTPEKPGFYNLACLNESIARASYLMQLGKSICDTALYFPANDLWAGGAAAKVATCSYTHMGENMEKRHIDFDIIDDEGIRACKITNEGLCIGDAVYRHICLPKAEYIPPDVYEKIKPYIGAGKPYLTCDNDNLRIKCKRLQTKEEIYAVFNESAAVQSARLGFEDTKCLYRLEAESGRITRVREESVSLYGGETAFFIKTDKKIVCDGEHFIPQVTLTSFKITGAKRFVITERGTEAHNIEAHGEKYIPSDDFSGEAECEFAYKIDNADENAQYMLELFGARYSARVRVNGHDVGSCAMSPMRVYFSGKHLKKEGVISVCVANTAANEISAKEDIIRSWDKSEVGGYHRQTRIFERDSISGQSGKIIKKIIIYKISD